MQESQETQVGSLRQEDPLEKEMVTYSSIIAWGIPWTEEPGGLQSMGSQRVIHDWVTEHAHTAALHVKVKGLSTATKRQGLGEGYPLVLGPLAPSPR